MPYNYAHLSIMLSQGHRDEVSLRTEVHAKITYAL